MRGLKNIMAILAILAPTAAWAHCACRCPERHHHARVQTHHWDEADDWAPSRYFERVVIAQRPCDNYPASAARVHASGVTWLNVRVGADGWVRASALRDSSGRADLDRAAMACVADWHFGRAGVGSWQAVRVVWRWHTAWG